MEVCITKLFTYAGYFLLVAAISFVLLTGLTAVLKFQVLIDRGPDHNADLAGAGNALHREILRRLGSHVRAPLPFSVLFIRVHGEDNEACPPAEAMSDVIPILRKRLRKTDLVRRDTKNGPLVLSWIQGAAIRISSAVAGYPEDGRTLQKLLERVRGFLDKGGMSDLPANVDDTDTGPSPGKSGHVLDAQRITDTLRRYIARFRRRGLPVSVMLLRIDRHQENRVSRIAIEHVATLLRRVLRGTDPVGHFNDETLVAAVDCAPEEALTVSRRVASYIKNNPLKNNADEVQIVVSIAIAGYPDHGQLLPELLSAGETTLCEIRKTGSGTCEVFREDESALQARKYGR